jgi:hypothetical protein
MPIDYKQRSGFRVLVISHVEKCVESLRGRFSEVEPEDGQLQ